MTNVPLDGFARNLGALVTCDVANVPRFAGNALEWDVGHVSRGVSGGRARDTGTMATRVSSSIFVGRSVELAELEAALADAAAGRPWLAFVAGDSGVGKTRLLSEFAARARASGARTLSGDCVRLGEGELPYAPLVAALRTLARSGDPVLEDLPNSVRAELSTLIPGLSKAVPTPSTADDPSAQARLFEALLWLLDRLSEEGPVLLEIEDLHWADRATRAFVTFMGRSLCRERVLIVATYRPDELHRRHPLRPVLAELERDIGSRRIELSPLTRQELFEQLSDLLGEPPDTGLVDRVFARSEGHPLFVEELIAAGRDGRGALPSTLRDALMVRVERLSPAVQPVLRVIAVGQRLDDELLVDATGLDRFELLRSAARGRDQLHPGCHRRGPLPLPPRAAARGRRRRSAARRAGRDRPPPGGGARGAPGARRPERVCLGGDRPPLCLGR